MISTLYDYFKSKGQALPSVAQRAQTYGLGNDYRGTAEQNNALLAKLQGGQAGASTLPASTAMSGQAMTPAPQTSTPAPVATPASNSATMNSDDYLKAYLANLTPGAEEQTTQNDLTTLEGSTRQGVAGLEGRGLGIPLSLVRGQQAQLERQGELKQQTLRQKLANLQATRKSAIDVSKTVLDRADSAAKAASDRLYEEQKLAKEAALKAETPYTLSAGQTRYDSKGNVLSSVAPKATSSKAPATPKGTYTSGGLTYTPQMGAEDSQELENSRGEDGYVDPTIYQNLYNAWIQNGGTAKGFTAYYPPKQYVNPANTWLPKNLMPATTKSKTSSGGTRTP